MDPVSLALYGGLDGVLQCQRGIIRRDQALAAGIAESTLESLISRGRWTVLLPRVYSVGADLTDPVVRTRAGWLWAGDDAVVSGPAAAWWLGLTARPPHRVNLTIPPTRRMSRQSGFVILRSWVDHADSAAIDRITVTSVARTCLDLARSGDEDLLETALRKRMLTQEQLQTSLDLGRGTRGQIRAREATEAVADNPWSHPERFAHRLFRDAGLTGWTGNAPVHTQDGARFPDIRFEKIKLLVEIDGRRVHNTPEAFDDDHDRQNQFVLTGWTVLRVTPAQLANNPARVLATVRGTIARLEAAQRREALGEKARAGIVS